MNVSRVDECVEDVGCGAEYECVAFRCSPHNLHPAFDGDIHTPEPCQAPLQSPMYPVP